MDPDAIQKILNEERDLIEHEVREDPRFKAAERLLAEVGDSHTPELARRVTERLTAGGWSGVAECSAYPEMRISASILLEAGQ